MSVNFRTISFVKETANHYPSLNPYEEKLLNWIEESNDNKVRFIANPVGVAQEVTGDKNLISKLELLKRELTFPFTGISPYTDYKLNTHKSIISKTSDSPTADYTYGWDCVASSKIATLNKYLQLLLGKNFKISVPDNNIRGIQVVGLVLGLFQVITDGIEGGNFVTLYFPINEGILYDEVEKVNVDLSGFSFNMRVKLEEVFVNTDLSDPNKQEGKIEYYLNLSSDYIDKIEVDKSMNSNYDVTYFEAYLKSVLSLDDYRINLFTVDVSDKDKIGELIQNHNYLVPTESYFASGNSSDENKSCLSALIQTITVKNSRQIMTSIDSIPDGADIGLNISNEIFIKHILIDCLTKGLNNQYSLGLTEDSFSVITNNDTVVGLRTNDEVTIRIPVDNSPDVDLSHLQIIVNSTEEFEMSGDIHATLAHFFDIRGSFCGKFKFVIEDSKDEEGKTVQIIKLSAVGDPVIDADCKVGILSYIVMSVLFAGGIIGIIAGIIVLILDKIIDSNVDSLNIDNFINTDDLLNGKLRWGFTGIGKITVVKPMACLQIGFKSRGLKDNE